MRLSNEDFPTDLLLRTPRISKDSHKRSSVEYRPRSLTYRLKESNTSTHTKTSSEVPSALLPKSRQIIENTFKNKSQYTHFAQKCLTLISKKNNTSQVQDIHQKETINSMFKNIRQQLKFSEKRREARERESNDNFLIVRSQIHQPSMYNSEDKMEFYRLNRASEMSAESMKKVLKERERTLRYALNPFDNVSISCLSASLKKVVKEQNQPALVKYTSHSNKRSASRQVVALPKPSYPKTMSFHLSQDSDSAYPKKLKSYLDFMFKINFSNGIYVHLSLSKPEEPTPKYKMYIGKGNNSFLLKGVMKRRFWWQITSNQNQEGIDFFWSQNKIDRIHDLQIKVGRKEGKQWKNIKKDRNLQEVYEMNRKVMNHDQFIAVQKFIKSQSFGLPFQSPYHPDFMTNHLPNNHSIGSKKNLFKSLLYYHKNITKLDPFAYLPKTYHIKSTDDPQYAKFVEQNQIQPNKMWIVKPGEHTNRGRSIELSTFGAISAHLPKARHQNGQSVTYILQDYLTRPLLYNGRKFDIRHYLLITSVNGQLKAYWYRDGYLRTSSYLFDLSSDNIYVHLTNDALQQRCQAFQKYQAGNKLSYTQFQRYLDFNYPRHINFQKDIMGRMKQIALDLMMANYHVLDGNRNGNNFELVGLDFMIDRDFKPWLLEANYNPCLEVNCSVLERIVPGLVQNTLRLGLDPLFPPTSHYPPNQRYHLVDNYLKHCKYELLFDQTTLKDSIANIYPFEEGQYQQLMEYPDDGRQMAQTPLIPQSQTSQPLQ